MASIFSRGVPIQSYAMLIFAKIQGLAVASLDQTQIIHHHVLQVCMLFKVGTVLK